VYLIKEIKLPDESYFYLADDNTHKDSIESLSKINIFVGENNSGKSRLIRNILSKELNYIPNSFSIGDLNNAIENIKKNISAYYKQNRDISIPEIDDILNKISSIKYYNDSVKIHEQLIEIKKQIESVQKQKERLWPHANLYYSQAGLNIMKIFEKEVSLLGDNFKNIVPQKFKTIYIPILRGIRPINYSNNTFFNEDVYSIRTKFDYFKDSKNDFEIFTGLTAYKLIKSFLLGNHKQRLLIKEYEDFLSKNFFDSKPITLIPSEDKDVLTIKVGEELEQPIYNLGDGIQSIIIITIPLFLHKGENLLFFIEEPEELIHPGLQRKMMETFSNQKGFGNCQYFITTHSNHFLDLTLDFSEISVYALRKELKGDASDEKIPTFSIQNLSQGDSSSLELLGVRNSSVFLSNCTIWVEGITDRLYFRHYLEIYMNKLKVEKSNNFIDFREDYHYSFIEYGGGNITHWSFLNKEEKPINVERLCGRLFLIVDKDKDKKERHEELKKVLADRFYPLECKEVENLLSKDVLLKIIEDYEGAKPDIDFDESDYKDEYIGKFIDEKLGAKKKRKGTYKTESGTISDKVGFCKKAIIHIKRWDDLSDESKKICVKMYDFIKQNNK
jgi:predicted ATP-dependent endonuclease of OLD family